MGAAGRYMWASRGMSWWQIRTHGDTLHAPLSSIVDSLAASTTAVVRVSLAISACLFHPASLAQTVNSVQLHSLLLRRTPCGTMSQTTSQGEQNVALEDQQLLEIYRKCFPSGKYFLK